jgi:geranylgeranylglycerol-phosphate geranylgeranyltransferase
MSFNNIVNKVIAIIKITRPVNVILTLISIAIAAVICSGRVFTLDKIIFAAASGALAAAAGNIINDFFDIEIDKINRPYRPLASNKLTRGEALLLFVLLALFSLLLAYFINIPAILIDASAICLLYLYSSRLKRIILLGNFIVAFLTGLAFIYGGVSVNNLKNAFIPAGFAFLINFIRELIKDMEDIEGDKAAGIFTLPYKYGFKISKLIISVSVFVLIVSTFIPFISGIYNIEYFIIIMALVNPVLIYSLKSLYKDDKERNLNRISKLLKLDMLFGLIAIYLGK